MAARDARRQHARRGRYKAQRTRLRQARVGPRQVGLSAAPVRNALLENGTHVLFGAELGRYDTGEVTLAKKVVTRLPADALCLADRNFFSYSLWNAALRSSAALLWRVRVDLILPKLKRLSDGSYLTKIYPSPHARARDRDGVFARLITYRLGNGTEEYRLL